MPAFLVEHGGLNSGFMIAQCTAAALGKDQTGALSGTLFYSLASGSNVHGIWLKLYDKPLNPLPGDHAISRFQSVLLAD